MTDWTKTPPSEPGWYWMRWNRDGHIGEWFVARRDGRGYWWHDGEPHATSGYEWSPVPIAPPEVKM